MPRINLDFSGVEERNFDPLPAGAYPVKVTGAEIRDSKSSAFQYVNWELTVESGNGEGRKLWTITSFNPAALWKLKETLVAFGEKEEKLAGKFDLDPDKYLNARAVALVDVESYTDNSGKAQTRNVVNSMTVPEPAVAGGPRRLT